MQSRSERVWNLPKEYDDAIRRMLRFTNSLDSAIAKLREGNSGALSSRALSWCA